MFNFLFSSGLLLYAYGCIVYVLHLGPFDSIHNTGVKYISRPTEQQTKGFSVKREKAH